MQAVIKSKLKFKMINSDNVTYEVKEKSKNYKFGLSLKFYQKLFILIFISCVLLIFPESPKNSEVLCEKFHPTAACIVW